MKKQHSYKEIANNYNLWVKYVGHDATMTESEFNEMTEDDKVKKQEELYGKEKSAVKVDSTVYDTILGGGWF